MPGVLIVEALAQTGAVAILSKPENKGRIAYFGGIDKCRFKGKVQPGDKLKTGNESHETERAYGCWRGCGNCGWKGCSESGTYFYGGLDRYILRYSEG